MATSVRTRRLTSRPLNKFSPLDSIPTRAVSLAQATRESLVTAGISTVAAERLLAARKPLGHFSLHDIGSLTGLSADELERIRRSVLMDGDTRLFITDVVPVANWIMSGKPFALRLHLAFTDASK